MRDGVRGAAGKRAFYTIKDARDGQVEDADADDPEGVAGADGAVYCGDVLFWVAGAFAGPDVGGAVQGVVEMQAGIGVKVGLPPRFAP